jgi:cation diffusion facilitator family transporter
VWPPTCASIGAAARGAVARTTAAPGRLAKPARRHYDDARVHARDDRARRTFPVPESMASSTLPRFAWLSIAAALLTIAIKGFAYLLTGSVGLLSDALESLVNLAGAVMALTMLSIAARPADADHPYGHDKAEYFSSGVEGTLILVAAASIAVAAIARLLQPRVLEQIGLGLGLALAASLVNLVVALVLLRAGRRHRSIALEASARHLLTDVWTSIGVVVGVGLVALTHWLWLDAVVALVVAANIVWTGFGIVRQSVLGLMDTALAPVERTALEDAMRPYLSEGIQYHALRTRQSGARRFVTLHVLVPGAWTVQQGHQLLERLEADIRRAIPYVSVLTHLEALEDPASWEDVTLDRTGGSGAPRA